MAAEQVTGGTTVAHVEFDAAPSALLAYRYPGVLNLHDVTDLVWADINADVVTAGWPCQPWSQAGLRKGADDPRHLFPHIIMGLERMRPALFLGENVRGHLSLGFDIVLAELDRIAYDVRWTLLRAADVGAPHGRSRLWIAARAREAGGWPAPVGEPSALAEDGGWTDPASGLFGSIPARRPGTAGVMVDGLRWDSDAVTVNSGTLLPTPRATRGGSATETVALLPTPTASESTGPGYTDRVNGGGRNLRTEVSLLPTLLPTPRATDGTKGGPNQRGSSGDLMLPSAVVQLLPTPTAHDDGKSPEAHAAMKRRMKGGPRDTITSLSVLARNGMDPLLPTPAATDAKGARNSTAGRQPGSQHHSGDTLGDLIFDGRLLPTPVAADGGGPRASSAGWGLRDESRAIAAAPSTWGPYAAAVARWANLTRPAPPPTEQGRNGPRLSPRFVEWLMGLSAGWVTDVPGITRNAALKMLGNGVCVQQSVAAYTLLGVAELYPQEAAA